MKTCVLIPTYNEKKAIKGIVEQVRGRSLDVIVVDDGSVDGTAEIAAKCGATVLSNKKNLGKGNALAKGFNKALEKNYDYIITMDGDGQHLPVDLELLIERADKSSNCFFIGNRMSTSAGMPLVRYLTNKVMSVFLSAMIKQNIPDTQCGYRLIKSQALKKLDLRTGKYEMESELLVRAAGLGFKIESVDIHTVYSGQKSKINPALDTIRFIRFVIKEIFRKK